MAATTDRTIDWYRVPIDPQELTALNQRSDGKGMVQAGGYLAILIVTGVGAYLSWLWLPWYVTLAALFLHGTVRHFTINAVHELVHGTVFRTAWLNSFFVNIFSFLGWHNHRFFWGSHSEHHKFTLHPPDDLEVVLPATQTIRAFVKTAVIDPILLWQKIKEHSRIARGRFQGEWPEHLFPESDVTRRKQVSQWARVILIGHAAIAIVSLASGQWIIPIIVSLAPFIAGWLFFLCNNTQHTGLVDNVEDFRLCCRTIYLNPVVRFLYWQMNYHTEHHMYAAVPCYNLARLHRAVRHEMPPTLNGLLETWVQIGHIMTRQKHDPTYQYVQPLPGEKRTGAPAISTAAAKEKASTTTVGSNEQPRPTSRRWECSVCGFIYDEALGLPEEGIAPGTAWEDIPDDWCCPDCGVSKADFEMVEITDRSEAA